MDGKKMTRQRLIILIASVAVFGIAAAAVRVPPLFITSDRCVACHNGLVTPRGEDVSIGTDWRASMMANSARDPYWQASIRRETLAHPTVAAAIEHECSACHMPMTRYQAKAGGGMGQVFTHLPVIPQKTPEHALAADGVSCTLCHQIGKDKLGEGQLRRGIRRRHDGRRRFAQGLRPL
jgi:cytochrome c551/c552